MATITRHSPRLIPGIILGAAILSLSLLAIVHPAPAKKPQPAYNPEIDVPLSVVKLMALPESEIDIGRAALILTKEIFPATDVDAYSRRIDAIADEVKARARGATDAPDRIQALNDVFYNVEGFHYNFDPLAGSDPKNRFITGILDSKLGDCYTMVLLYVAVAQRAKYPIYPVPVPRHFFVRYVDRFFHTARSIEVTSGGQHLTDRQYITADGIRPPGIESGGYFRTLSYKQFLAVLLEENAAYLANHQQHNEGWQAIAYLENARVLNPDDAIIYQDLFAAYEAASHAQYVTPDFKAGFHAESVRYRGIAEQMGFVQDEDIPSLHEDHHHEKELRRKFLSGGAPDNTEAGGS